MQSKTGIEQDLDRERQRYINWLNAENISNQEEIKGLEKELNDGIILLKIIELIQPGIVDWNKVNTPAVNKFKKLGNCNYMLKLCKELRLPITGVGGRDIVDGNTNLLFGVVWLLMRESFIAKHGPKSDDEVNKWANQFLDTVEDDIELDELDEFPYVVILYRGDEGEVFMGDDIEIYDCPFMPVSFENMVSWQSKEAKRIEIDFKYFLNRSKKSHARDNFEEDEADTCATVDELGLFEDSVEAMSEYKITEIDFFKEGEEGSSVTKQEPVVRPKQISKIMKKREKKSKMDEGIQTPVKPTSMMHVLKSSSKSKMKQVLEKHLASGSKVEVKTKAWMDQDDRDESDMVINFASDEAEETPLIDDSSYHSENFNTAPLMCEDQNEDTPNNLTLVKQSNVEYNVAKGFKADTPGETDFGNFTFIKEKTKRTLFPISPSFANFTGRDKSPKTRSSQNLEDKVIKEEGIGQSDVIIEPENENPTKEKEIKGNDGKGDCKEGVTLLDMMSTKNLEEYYLNILTKCMEKNYFSRFKVGKKVSLPFYLMTKPQFSLELQLQLLKINRYFTKKFERIEPLAHTPLEPSNSAEFNYEAKMKEFDFKLRRLKLSLSVMKDEEKRFLHFQKEAKKMQEDPNLSLKSKLMLKRMELCVTKKTFEFQPKRENLKEKKRYLDYNGYKNIDEGMQSLFYRKALLMRLSHRLSAVYRFQKEKVGELFCKFIKKYENPIREEVNEEMIKKFVEENQGDLTGSRVINN